MNLTIFERLRTQSPSYYRLSTESSSDGFEDKDVAAPQPKQSRRRTLWLAIASVAILAAGLALVFAFVTSTGSVLATQACTNPATRREWRSLSSSEKQEYLDSVNCLRTKPSKLGLNHSMYDDFPYVHSRVGHTAHMSASFLSWHRYLLHIYETTLQDECGYSGHLTYWDWTLDWEDVTKAPVFGSELAFGSNGHGQGDKSQVSHGHGRQSPDPKHDHDDKPMAQIPGGCVTDGPFANLTVLYLGHDGSYPHCLTRGFESEEIIHKLGVDLQPANIERLMLEDEYEEFNLDLEKTGHNAIPFIIRGDFLMFTAPYDPIFYLHHTQLDRLWSKWQERDPARRMRSYGGPFAPHSAERASIADLIPMGGLVPDRPVSDIIDPRKGGLCYRYM